MATIADTLGQSGGVSLPRILLAGTAGGLVDMIYFSTRALVDGRNPINVFRSVGRFWPTSGLDRDGSLLAALGCATHFGLATIMAAGFVLTMPLLLSTLRSIWLAGALYGVFLYTVMYLVVMPMRWPKIFPHFEGWSSVLDILLHIAVGVTFVAILARRASSGTS